MPDLIYCPQGLPVDDQSAFFTLVEGLEILPPVEHGSTATQGG